jgi:4-amino-4-deoxy-L-arabinose transferase-like glycosyltransferase
MTSETSEIADDNRRTMLLLHGGLLLLAAIYWIVSAGISAPFVYHPDEPDVVGRAVKMVVTGEMNPHWFHYPTLLMYIYAAIFKCLGVFLDVPMGFGVFEKFQGAHPKVFPLYYAARLVMICFSLGTLYLMLRLCSRLTSPLVASLAGITFVGSDIVRESAASATVDMPAAFFALASLLLMVRFLDSAQNGEAKESNLWIAAVMGGLAAGAKYNGGAVLLAVPLAMWLARMPLGWSLRRLPLLALVSIAAFTVTTPWIVLDARTFFDTDKGVLFHFVHYSSGHAGADEGVAFLKALSDLLHRHSYLTPLALLSPLALWAKPELSGKRSRDPLWTIIFAAVLFLGMVGVASIYFARNLLPMMPPLDCLIAVGAWALVNLITRGAATKKKFSFRVLLWIIISVGAFGCSLVSAQETWRRTQETDTRTLAYEWITKNVPPGARMLQEAYCPQLYFADRFEITYLWSVSQMPYENAAKRYDYVVVSETQWARYHNWGSETYERVFKNSLVSSWTGEPGKSYGPEIRLYSIKDTVNRP